MKSNHLSPSRKRDGHVASTAGTRQETPYVIDLFSIELPGPPIPNGRVAELVRLIDHGFGGDDVPLAFDSDLVAITGNVPFILRRVSVCGCTAALTRFVLQSLNPFAYRRINIAVLAVVSRRRVGGRYDAQKKADHWQGDVMVLSGSQMKTHRRLAASCSHLIPTTYCRSQRSEGSGVPPGAVIRLGAEACLRAAGVRGAPLGV